MQIFPNYYSQFHCIADKCDHSCCIGWEIDIDEKTLENYNSQNTPFGEKIRSKIEGDEPHFVLSEDERCPFLQKNGLCEIIINCGEDALCDICRLHPRFCNFYSGFTEIGLGLCCEEAARIILAQTEKFSIDIPEDASLTDFEKEFFDVRSEIFDILQNRDLSIKERFSLLSKKFGFEFEFDLSKLCDKYISLERLDDNWTDVLLRLENCSFDESIFERQDMSVAFEQLSVYFVFRHLHSAIDFVNYADYVRFSLVSTYMIAAVCAMTGKTSPRDISEICRMYSSEIEYSEENVLELVEFSF